MLYGSLDTCSERVYRAPLGGRCDTQGRIFLPLTTVDTAVSGANTISSLDGSS